MVIRKTFIVARPVVGATTYEMVKVHACDYVTSESYMTEYILEDWKDNKPFYTKISPDTFLEYKENMLNL